MSEVSKSVEKAERLLQRGRPDAAVQEFLHILELDPDNEAACNTAADICISLGRNGEAVRLLSDLFDRQCEHGDKPRAAITYKKIARITQPSGDRSLRFARELAKDKRESLKAFQSAFQAFTAKGRTEEAAVALNGIVELDATVENFRKLGGLNSELGKSGAASAAYFRAGQIETDDQAKLYLFEKAYKLSEQDCSLCVAYGGALLEAGRAKIAVDVLAPIATDVALKDKDAQTVKALYGRSLLNCGRADEAAPLLWQAFEQNLRDSSEIEEVIVQLAAERSDQAIEWARKLQQREFKSGRRREFVAFVKLLGEKCSPTAELLEYMAEVFNYANREHDYCETLIKVFDLHYASGNFSQAADCLDRAAEVDAYEPGHLARVEMLRGKVAHEQLKAIADRLTTATAGSAENCDRAVEYKVESNALDDLILQAQIYLRYGMVAKARERLERIQELFPNEQQNVPELRDLFLAAGVLPSTTVPPPPSVSERRNTRQNLEDAANDGGNTVRVAPAAALDEIGAIAEITRDLYRESSVKSVLSTAVNALGRRCGASRCLAVLSTPGKPPSIAVEYCAPGLQQSDIQDIVKIVGLLQPLSLVHGLLEVCGKKTRAIFKSLRKPLQTLGMDSVLALPLVDGDEHVGVMLMSQSGDIREWSTRETALFKAISEQAILAIHNVRLRRLVKDLAVTEEGSGLVKRSSYVDVLLAEVKRSQQQSSPLSLMLMNLATAEGGSHAPAQNEKLLRHVARLVSSNVRQNDIAFRYGPSTVAVVLADTTGKNAMLAADKLRKVASVASVPSVDRPAAISIGVAEAVMEAAYDAADIVTELINRADRALQQASLTGNSATEFLPIPLASMAVSA